MAATNDDQKWFNNASKNVISMIKIDEKHHVMIFFFSVSEESDLIRWNVSYYCKNSKYDVIETYNFKTIMKAKVKAFELSQKKCSECYDENGMRRKQVKQDLDSDSCDY